MEELYKKYGIFYTNKVNKVIDTNLIFRFSRTTIEPSSILLPAIVLAFSIYTQSLEYLWYLLFFVAYIIINKLLTYKVTFDEENIFINSLFVNKVIYYKDGIKVFIEKRDGSSIGIRKLIEELVFKENGYRYYLIIRYDDNLEYITLCSCISADSIVTESTKKEMEKFLNNFIFDEMNIQKKQNNTNIRLKNIQI